MTMRGGLMQSIHAFCKRACLGALAMLLLPISAQGQGAAVPFAIVPWDLLPTVAGFGAIGGVIYELIALHGNIEWPHKTSETEVPMGGFTHAQLGHLFDLGIVARIIIGAAAAVVVFWALPLEQGIRLLAVSLIAGSAGTAVFRSLQDRLLASLNAAKVEEVAAGLEDLNQRLTVSSGSASGGAGFAPAAVTTDVAEIRGRVQALLSIARPRTKPRSP